MSKPEILIVGPMHAGAIERLDAEFITHKYWLAEDKDALVAKVAANMIPQVPNTRGERGDVCFGFLCVIFCCCC